MNPHGLAARVLALAVVVSAGALAAPFAAPMRPVAAGTAPMRPVAAGTAPMRPVAADAAPFATSAVTRYQVTFVARACASYDLVMANQVRDDGAESLGRPGVASAYQPGQPVDPEIETPHAARCEPLVGWTFSLGSTRVSRGPLSVVSGATSTTPATVATTPRLDETGRATKSSIAGAVTVVLTDEQVRQSVQRQLWVQGGTPDDPLLAGAFGGDLSFGVLRCGLDGHAGTHTQWLGFAAGARQAFCYAYYVRGAPAAGTVTVRARTTRTLGYPRAFDFSSPLSFADDGAFSVSSSGDPGDVAFLRAAGATPYPIQAKLPTGWKLAGLTCAASRPGGGAPASRATTDVAAARAAVTLAAGDLVLCTFTLDPPAAPPGLTVAVHTENGAGTFAISVGGGGGDPRTLTSTTTDGGPATVATGADLSGLTAGAYPVTVTLPTDNADRWSLSAVTCNGVTPTLRGLTATVTLVDGVPLECVLRLTHRPGSLQLRVVTAGGVASGGLSVVPVGRATGWWAGANTTGYGVPASAAGDLPAQLAFGSYLITPIAPRATVDGGWQLSSFTCGPGAAAPAATSGTSAIRLLLTAADPDAVCTVSYQPVPSTRLQVVVQAEGSPLGRASAVIIEVSCADGSAGRIVFDAQGAQRDSLAEPLSFLEPTTCTVSQPETGAAQGSTVTTQVSLEPLTGDVPPGLPTQFDIARDVPRYTLTVTDRFTAPVTGAQEASFLRDVKTLPVVLAGVGLIVLGVLLLAGLVLRQRARRHDAEAADGGVEVVGTGDAPGGGEGPGSRSGGADGAAGAAEAGAGGSGAPGNG